MKVTYDEANTMCSNLNAFLPLILDDVTRDNAFRFAVYQNVSEWKFWVHESTIAQNIGGDNSTYVYRDRFMNLNTDKFIQSYEEAYKAPPTIPPREELNQMFRSQRVFSTCTYFK